MIAHLGKASNIGLGWSLTAALAWTAAERRVRGCTLVRTALHRKCVHKQIYKPQGTI